MEGTKCHFCGSVRGRNAGSLIVGIVQALVGSLGRTVVPGIYSPNCFGNDIGAEGRGLVARSGTPDAVCAMAGPRVDFDGDAHFTFSAAANGGAKCDTTF